MKLLMLLAGTLLILACGADNSEEVLPVTESDADVAVEVVVDDEIEVEIEPETEEEVEIEAVVEVDSLYLLENGSAGLFSIYMTRDEIEEATANYENLVVEEIDLMAEGMATPAIALTFESAGAILLELTEDGESVFRIFIRSNLFVTEDGISIDSFFGDLVTSYDVNDVVWGAEGDPVAIVQEIGMSFILSPGDWWQQGDVVGEIPADAGLKAIILW